MFLTWLPSISSTRLQHALDYNITTVRKPIEKVITMYIVTTKPNQTPPLRCKELAEILLSAAAQQCLEAVSI